MSQSIETFADLEWFARHDVWRPNVTIKYRNGCWYTRIEAPASAHYTVERGNATLSESIRLAVDDYRAKRAGAA